MDEDSIKRAIQETLFDASSDLTARLRAINGDAYVSLRADKLATVITVDYDQYIVRVTKRK